MPATTGTAAAIDHSGIDGRTRSQAIDLYRLMAILAMVTTHLPYVLDPNRTIALARQATEDWHAIHPGSLVQVIEDNLVLFLSWGVGRGAVPALSMVSAWFLIDGMQKRGMFVTLRNRLMTLGIPYLFWNAAFFAVVVLALGKPLEGNPLRQAMGLGTWPINYPLHFLLDLLITILVYAALRPVLANRPLTTFMVGMLLTLVTLLAGRHEFIVGDNAGSFLPRSHIVFWFFFGAACHSVRDAIFRRDVVAWLTRPITILGLCGGAYGAAVVQALVKSKAELADPLQETVFFFATTLACAVSVLFLLSVVLLIATRTSWDLSRRLIFRIFCAHVILISALYILVPGEIRHASPFATFLLALLSCIGFGFLVHKALEALDRHVPIELNRYL